MYIQNKAWFTMAFRVPGQLPDGPASSNTKIYVIILKTYYNFHSNEVVQFAKWTESSFYESHFAGIFLLKQEENIFFFHFLRRTPIFEEPYLCNYST